MLRDLIALEVPNINGILSKFVEYICSRVFDNNHLNVYSNYLTPMKNVTSWSKEQNFPG